LVVPDVDANFTACSNNPAYQYENNTEAKILCKNVQGVSESDVDGYATKGLCEAPCVDQNDMFSCLSDVVDSLPDLIDGTVPMLSAYIVFQGKNGPDCFGDSISTVDGTPTCASPDCVFEPNSQTSGDCLNGFLQIKFGIFRHTDDCFTASLYNYNSEGLTLFRSQGMLIYYTGTMKGSCTGSACITSGVVLANENQTSDGRATIVISTSGAFNQENDGGTEDEDQSPRVEKPSADSYSFKWSVSNIVLASLGGVFFLAVLTVIRGSGTMGTYQIAMNSQHAGAVGQETAVFVSSKIDADKARFHTMLWGNEREKGV